ncbi:MAG: hypothetical protein WCI20_09230 [bacterium]
MFKAADKWLPGYLRSVLWRPHSAPGVRHLIFCVCDHYEPFRGGVDPVTARQTVKDWLSAYPVATDSFRDAEGRPPKHTFFYPQEEYDADILDDLADFCRGGFGEVEIHLHHRHDTPEGFREKLVTFRNWLHERHGLLGEERGLSCCPVSSPIRYAFIHGNWSLCNSRPDGDWCGVNEELGILKETGCYADYTFPSAPSPTQPRLVNAIYYARDTPGKPRGADGGTRVEVRSQKSKSRSQHPEVRIQNATEIPLPLMIITGPLALNWRRRKWGIVPRLENAEITGANPPTPDRISLWAKPQIGVVGRPDWVFVKVHTHGCVPENARVMLGTAMRQAHEALQKEFNDGTNWQLHYVTAREMHNLVKAAELNLPGPPGLYRDTPIIWSA